MEVVLRSRATGRDISTGALAAAYLRVALLGDEESVVHRQFDEIAPRVAHVPRVPAQYTVLGAFATSPPASAHLAATSSTSGGRVKLIANEVYPGGSKSRRSASQEARDHRAATKPFICTKAMSSPKRVLMTQPMAL